MLLLDLTRTGERMERVNRREKESEMEKNDTKNKADNHREHLYKYVQAGKKIINHNKNIFYLREFIKNHPLVAPLFFPRFNQLDLMI